MYIFFSKFIIFSIIHSISKSPELKWVEDAADIDFEGLKKYTSLLHVFFKNEYIIQVSFMELTPEYQ